MIKIINQWNYTGNKAKIRINKNKKTLSLFGVYGQKKWEVFKIMYKYKGHYEVFNDNLNYSIVNVFKFNNIYHAYDNNDYISRENSCIYTAIAQVLYNIL